MTTGTSVESCQSLTAFTEVALPAIAHLVWIITDYGIQMDYSTSNMDLYQIICPAESGIIFFIGLNDGA